MDHGATEDWTFKTQATILCSQNSALENPLCATAVYRPMTVEHFLQDCQTDQDLRTLPAGLSD